MKTISQAFSPNHTWLIVKGANSTHVYQNCVHLDNHEHVERKSGWQSYCLPPDSEPEAESGFNQNQGASQRQKHENQFIGRPFSHCTVRAFSVLTENVFVFILPIVEFIIYLTILWEIGTDNTLVCVAREKRTGCLSTHPAAVNNTRQAPTVCATKKIQHCTLIAGFNWPLLTAEW